MDFICPKCHLPLVTGEGGAAVCAAGHSYDRARAGYYNLLLGAGGGTHGDNRDMVEARRAFLSGGYYRPLAEEIASLALKYCPAGGLVLDAGCGEGYYTDTVERALLCRDGISRVMAFDISKDAVRAVARKNNRISLAVGGSYSMPVADGALELVLNTFSPLALSEVTRVLKRGGVFIFVYPAEEHLFELKAAIYDTPYKNTPEDTHLSGLTHVETKRLTFKMTFDSEDAIRNLFMMTPYAYRTSEKGRARVLNLNRLDCTADFYIGIYKKDN